MSLTKAQLEELVSDFNVSVDTNADDKQGEFADKFCKIWPTVRKILVIVRDLPFTNKKVDEALDKIIDTADDICGDGDADSGSIKIICKYWPVAKPALKAVMFFTNKKVDKVITEFINVVDLVCD